MLATKRVSGVAPGVTLGEHVTCMPLPSVNEAAHSGFEIQRKGNSRGISNSTKGLMSSNFFKFYKKN